MSAMTGRTLEDIERQAAEIDQAERDAIATYVHCLRELAVLLPQGSTLVYDFVKMAKFADMMNAGGSPGPSLVLTSINVARAYNERRAAHGGGASAT